MRKTWVILLIFNLLFLSLGASEVVDDYEEGLIYLRVNKRFGDSFFPALFRGDGRKVYIEVEELLSFLDVRTVKFDPEERSIEGQLFYRKELTADEVELKDFIGDVEHEKILIKDKKVYVEAEGISELIPVEYISWEREKYMLDIVLDFVLPVEVNEILERKENRILMGKQDLGEGNILQNEKKMFTPGVAQVKYLRSDFSDRSSDGGAEDELEINYYNQLLYGDFQMQTLLKPDHEISYAALQYKGALGENNIILGDATFQRDSLFSVDGSDFTGVSIVKDDILIEQDGNTITIGGQVLNGTTVELYQGNILVSVQRVRTDNLFLFEEVPFIGFSDSYTLKFYYPDGSYEERDVSILDDSDLQRKGEGDFYLQVGEIEDELAITTRYLYGVTENLTLGGGYLRGRTTENYIDGGRFTYSTLEGDIIYRTSAKKNPTLYSFKAFLDLDEEDSEVYSENKSSNITYKTRVLKTMFGHDVVLSYDEYSKTIANGEESDREYGIAISRTIGNFSYSIDYEREEEFEGDTDEYGLNLRYTVNNNLRLTLDNKFYNYSYDREDTLNSRFSVGYSGIKEIDLNIGVETERTSNDNSETYDVRISRKNRNLGKGDLDYYAYVSYSTGNVSGYTDDKWQYGIAFEYYFTDWLSTPSVLTDEDQEFGLAVDKTIILSDPLKKTSNPAPENAWIKGRVFKDENGNGEYDEGEEVFEGVSIFRGHFENKTNEKGEYFLDDIPSDTHYKLNVSLNDIDPMLKPLKEEYELILSPASGYILDIPLMAVSTIMGYVFFEGGNDLNERELMLAYQQTVIYLKKNNEIIMENNAELDGFFILDDVMPGEYQLEVSYLGSKGYRTSGEKYNLTVGADGEFIDGYKFELIPDTEKTTNKIKAKLIPKNKIDIEEREELFESKMKNYYVKRGDTLSLIAKRKGYRLEEILEINNWISNPNLIYPNQRLLIPPKSGVTSKSML